MVECSECEVEFDPAKDSFITFYERKSPSRDFCSLPCATRYINEEEA